MRIVIAGGHGQIAQLLQRRLAEAGHRPVGLVRSEKHVPDLAELGAEALLVDLEKSDPETVAALLDGADAVVFAAGAGPGSGAARKLTVDRDAAVLLADAAERAGVRRYVMISAIGVDDFDPDVDPETAEESDDVYQVYQRAKSEADADLRAREALDWTILRPGRLTDDEGTGHVSVGEDLERDEVSRGDVAHVAAHVLTTGAGVGRQVVVVRGDTPIEDLAL